MTFVKDNTKTLTNLFDELFVNLPSEFGKDLYQTVFTNPPVNIHENNEGFHIEMNAAGLQKSDFKIQTEKNLLTISYEKKEEAEQKTYKTIKKEFGMKSFKRSFTLNENVNTDGIQAKYENGILQIFIPKKEEVKIMPKQIEIA